MMSMTAFSSEQLVTWQFPADVPKTQAQPVQAMGTTQSVVARLESGYHRPSLATLEKVARVLDAHLEVRLERLPV